MIAIFTWLPKSRALALLILLQFQFNGAVAFADDDLTYDNIVLSVTSMPLSVFASTVEEGMSISIQVDESIEDFLIDGRFEGNIEYLLTELNTRYGINHSVSENVYHLWRDTGFLSPVSYQFQLSDMDLVSFLTYLSEAAGYQLVADTSIKITVDGAYNGTLKDTINALSHQYPILFYISEDTISVVPESSFVKSEVVLSDENYSPEAFLTDLRTKIPPGNFVNREDNQLIVGGHPDFVRRTELELQVDMSNAAILIPELLTTTLPVLSGDDDNATTDQSDSELPDHSTKGVPLEPVNSSDTVVTEPTVKTALTTAADTETTLAVEQEAENAATPGEESEGELTPELEAAVTSTQEIAVTETGEQGTEAAVSSEQKVDVIETPAQGTEVVVATEQEIESATTNDQEAEDAVMPEPDAEPTATPESGVVDETTSDNNASVGTVEQIPGFY